MINDFIPIHIKNQLEIQMIQSFAKKIYRALCQFDKYVIKINVQPNKG